MANVEVRARKETSGYAAGMSKCVNRDGDNIANYTANEGGGPFTLIGLPVQGGGESPDYTGDPQQAMANGKVAEAITFFGESSGDVTSTWFFPTTGSGSLFLDELALKNAVSVNDWVTALGDVSVVSSVMTINDVGAGHTIHAPGEVLRAVSSGDPDNNGFFVVVSSTATDLELETFGVPVVDTAVTFTITQTSLIDGNLSETITLETEYVDSGTFKTIPGIAVSGRTWAIPSTGWVSLTTSFIGSPPLADVVASLHTGAATSSLGGGPGVTGQCNIKRLLINGAEDDSFTVDNIDIAIEYPNRGVPGVVGSAGPSVLDTGDLLVTASMALRYTNNAFLNRNLKSEKISLHVICQDSTGNDIAIVLPRCAVSGGTPTLPDVSSGAPTASLTFNAELDSTQAGNPQIAIYTAAV